MICVMGEQENNQLILFELLLQEKYDHMDRVYSPIFPPPQEFVEDLISIETNSTWAKDFPILPPPEEFADDPESSKSEPESESEYPGSKYSEFCFCCSQIISTPDNSSNLETTKKYSEKDSNELKLGNMYEEIPDEVHSNKEHESKEIRNEDETGTTSGQDND